MDNVDITLLRILQNEGRITLSDLSKRINLSRPSVSERLTRLVESGIIEKFSAVVSFPGVGRDVLVFIQVSEVLLPYHKFEKIMHEHPDIIECHRVTGNINYILKAAVNDMNHLEELVDFLIPLGRINTSIVLKSPVKNKNILPSIQKDEQP